MSIEMTLAFVRAEVQRAEHHGKTTAEINIKDMHEILAKVESNIHHERAGGPMKRLGWVSPYDVHAMCSGPKGKRGLRMLRFKTPVNCMEVFYCDNLKEKMAESDVLQAAATEAARTKAEAKEVASEL